MGKRGALVGLVLVAVLVVASMAFAADGWDVSTITFDMTPVYAVGGLILVVAGGLVIFRVLKRVIR